MMHTLFTPLRWLFGTLCLPPGHVQAWLADGYKEAGALERSLIFPSWAFFRLIFLCFYYAARSLP